VIVFEIHGEPPYMLMIDGKPRARTMTVQAAAALAERFLPADRTDSASPKRKVAAVDADGTTVSSGSSQGFEPNMIESGGIAIGYVSATSGIERVHGRTDLRPPRAPDREPVSWQEAARRVISRATPRIETAGLPVPSPPSFNVHADTHLPHDPLTFLGGR
jgi:hypothetical protein